MDAKEDGGAFIQMKSNAIRFWYSTSWRPWLVFFLDDKLDMNWQKDPKQGI
jgi:hypothetical protein